MKMSGKARSILLLAGIIFFSMMSRAIFAPLLPYISEDLGLSHSEAGSFFLVISIGYAPAMLLSGFLAARLRHRGTILLALVLNAIGLSVAALSPSSLFTLLGLFVIGIGSGIYPPSGIASITNMVSSARTGQALAIHEMGPNLALVAAPLAVYVFYDLLSWRGVIWLLAILDLAVLFVLAKWRGIGEFKGSPPNFDCLKVILRIPTVWFCVLLFFIAIGSTQGIFSIMPLYLVTEKRLDPDSVNTLIGLSRISGVLMLFVAGTLVDRFGVKPVIMTAFVVSGLCTVLLGLTSGLLLMIVVALQPTLMIAFFPAGLTTVSRIGPPEARNVTFSVIINIAVFMGAGFIPSFFGWLGDRASTWLGFVLLGLVICVTAVFVLFDRSIERAVRATN